MKFRASRYLEILGIAAAALAVSGCQDLAATWQPVAADDGLFFDMPAFRDVSPVRSAHQDSAHFTINHQASWTAGGGYPRGALSYYAATAGTYFPQRAVVLGEKEIRSTWNAAPGVEIGVYQQRTTSNSLGPNAHYAIFRLGGNVRCVAFVQYFGAISAADNTSVGNRMIQGYYCGMPGSTMSDADAVQVVRSFRVETRL
jgi:hypothetical protein